MRSPDPLPPKAVKILDTLSFDEPVFIFRAKDVLSTLVLLHYVSLLESYNPHSDQVAEVVDLLNEFRDWQKANPDKVKLPD